MLKDVLKHVMLRSRFTGGTLNGSTRIFTDVKGREFLFRPDWADSRYIPKRRKESPSWEDYDLLDQSFYTSRLMSIMNTSFDSATLYGGHIYALDTNMPVYGMNYRGAILFRFVVDDNFSYDRAADLGIHQAAFLPVTPRITPQANKYLLPHSNRRYEDRPFSTMCSGYIQSFDYHFVDSSQAIRRKRRNDQILVGKTKCSDLRYNSSEYISEVINFARSMIVSSVRSPKGAILIPVQDSSSSAFFDAQSGFTTRPTYRLNQGWVPGFLKRGVKLGKFPENTLKYMDTPKVIQTALSYMERDNITKLCNLTIKKDQAVQ